MRALFFTGCLFLSAAVWATELDQLDPNTGLKVAPNWELVRAHCGACHSYQLVTAQRGDRDYWSTTIAWMQRSQNLWPLPEPILGQMLDYLAANYDETQWGRRPPLAPSLLPTSALGRDPIIDAPLQQ